MSRALSMASQEDPSRRRVYRLQLVWAKVAAFVQTSPNRSTRGRPPTCDTRVSRARQSPRPGRQDADPIGEPPPPYRRAGRASRQSALVVPGLRGHQGATRGCCRVRISSSLDKILAVGASVEGRPGVPTRRAGARCHPTRGIFVESGCTQSVTELDEKSAPSRLASSLPPGRGPAPTRMDHLSATNFVQTRVS